jgi:hypothetical protein
VRRSSIWFALILIAWVLIPSAAKSEPIKSADATESSRPQVTENSNASHSVQTNANPSVSPTQGQTPNLHDDKGSSDTYVREEANYTLLLVIVGALAVFVAVLGYCATKNAADAARESARAAKLALKANRPYLLIGKIECTVFAARGGDLVSATIHFRNYGKGPALVDTLLLAMDGKIPTGRDYSNCISFTLTSRAIAASGTSKCKIEHLLEHGSTSPLILYGHLTYRDVFREPDPYQTGLLWRYIPFSRLSGDAHFRYGGDEYNFYT